MSLINFPPLDAKGRPYALQEFNGQILTGSRAEFQAMAKSSFLSEFPSIERQNLNSLQHCLSKDDMRSTFVFQGNDRISTAYEIWNKEGASGVVDHLAHASETSSIWPLSRAGRAILKVRNGLSNMASKVLPSQTQEGFEDKLATFASTLNWKTNWIRSIAWHIDGKRLAVCQNNDYVRVYTIQQGTSKTPLTLKHPQQKNVAAMCWLPFDQRVLAVAAGDSIIIWRLGAKSSNIKVSSECAQVISVGSGPITNLFWDRTCSQTLICSSPNSNKIYIVDGSSRDVESVGAWTGGSITGLYPTEDGQRIAVSYTSNIIRVYDRSSWRDEKWSHLSGRCTTVVWSPNGDCLLFTTDNDPRIFVIHFTVRTGTNSDGQLESRWSGSAKALPIFDASPVEFDTSELEVEGGVVERELVRMGGPIHSMVLSKDSQRLAVQFRDNRCVVALFIMEWKPSVQLMPCGLIEAPLMGDASIISFVPKFDSGSMLTIVWSSGTVHYIPLIYGHSSSTVFSRQSILPEYDGGRVHDLSVNNEDDRINESLISAELPSTVGDTTRVDVTDENSQIVLFSDKLRTPAPTREFIGSD